MLFVTIPLTMQHASGLKLLDMMPFGYSPLYVNDLFKALGKVGRETYLFRQIPLDLLYPGLFAITYSLIFAFFLNKINQLKSPWVYGCLLPFIAGIADYLENVGIISMLFNYPTITVLNVKITAFFSILKSMSTTFFFTGLIVLLIFIIGKLTKQKLLKEA
jgi:hypothetical protein